MSDTDRKAFETWARSSGAAANDRGCDNFFSETMRIAYQAWQAACDHYAPKANDESYTHGWNEAMDYAAEVNAPRLTDREVVEKQRHAVAIALCKQEVPYDPFTPSCSAYKNSPPRYHGWLDKADTFLQSGPYRAALRAAGVRWKESGDGE
jgi:hypothetical protein